MKKPSFTIDDLPRPLRHEQTPASEDAPLAALFAQVDPLDPLTEIAAQRIRRRLERAVEPSGDRLPLWLKVTVASAAFAFMCEAVAATTLSAWPAARERLLGALSTRLPSHPVRREGVAPLPSEPIAVPEIIAALPPSAAEGAIRPAPLPSPPPVSRRAAPHPPSELRAPTPPRTADDPDVTLYTRALSQLNLEHDPTAALGTLEAYRFQHPNGLFRREAAVAEVQAELLLGRNREALALLDVMQARTFDGAPQASELRLLRAELLGQLGHCGDALPILAEYLGAAAVSSDVRQRALYARAGCLAQLGDLGGSEQARRAYLHEFPDGRFAPQVRKSFASPPAHSE